MNKKEVVAALLDLSNELDALGLYAEADTLTRVAQYPGLNPSDIEYNPDALGVEHGMLGESNFESEQKALQEMRNEDMLMELDAHIDQLKNNPNPSQDDLNELEQLLDYRFSPNFDFNNVKWPEKQNNMNDFAQDLENAGANVIEPSDNFM